MNYLFQVHIGVKGFVTVESKEPKINSNQIIGKPIQNAIISVEGISHEVTTSIHGDYWRLLMPGNYKITAKADGFLPQTKLITVVSNKTTSLNFTLKYSQDSTDTDQKQLDLDNLLTDSDKRYSLFINAIEPDIEIFKHHNNDEMLKLMKSSKDKCPSITSIYTIGKSEAGTSIYSIIFSGNPLFHEKGEPEIKYIGSLVIIKNLVIIKDVIKVFNLNFRKYAW